MIFIFDKDLKRAFDSTGTNAGEAWAYFLKKYSKIILKVIRSFTNNYDEVMDKYLFVCNKLSENSFSLLKKYNYNDKRKAKLSTWLTVVVRNLCVDQFRRTYGRKRLPAVFLNMNSTERKIFKYFFYEGLDSIQIAALIQQEKSIEEIELIVDRIKNFITKKNFFVEFDENISISEAIDYDIEVEEMNNILNYLIDSLIPIQKYVFKLRFWEGLTIKQISQLTNLSPRRVNYILEKVLIEFRTKIKDKL